MTDIKDVKFSAPEIGKMATVFLGGVLTVSGLAGGCVWYLSARLTTIEDAQKLILSQNIERARQTDLQWREIKHMEQYLKIPPLDQPQAYTTPEPDLSKKVDPQLPTVASE